MGVFSPLQLARRPVRSRVLVVYHVEPAALARRLPGDVKPRLVGGRAIAVLCYTRLGTLGSRFLPHRGACSNHLSYRFLVERTRKGELVPETWVARRETSSRLGAGLGEKLLGQDHGRSTFEVREDPLGLSLSVSSERGEEFYLRAEPCATSSSRFLPTAREVEALLDSCGDVHPSDFLAPEADAIDVRNVAAEPLTVFEIRSSFLGDPRCFPEGSATFDSAWRLVTQRLEPIREPKFARASVLRRGAPSQAFPAC